MRKLMPVFILTPRVQLMRLQDQNRNEGANACVHPDTQTLAAVSIGPEQNLFCRMCVQGCYIYVLKQGWPAISYCTELTI